MTGGQGPAFELETVPADYSDGANFQITDELAQETGMAKEGNSRKSKASAGFTQEIRRAPLAKDSSKGILKSKNKHCELSDALSKPYVDDEPDSSKEERDGDEINARSDRGTPEYSERTASPESSNPRLVRIFPTQSSPLAASPHRDLLKLPHPS